MSILAHHSTMKMHLRMEKWPARRCHPYLLQMYELRNMLYSKFQLPDQHAYASWPCKMSRLCLLLSS